VTLDDTVVDGDGVYVEIDDSSGNWIDYADVDGGGSVTLDEQLDPGKYFVSVQAETDDLVGETYDLSVDANADAIGSLDDVKTNCKNATSAASAAQTALSQAEKRLARARKSGSHRRKAQAHHAVKVARARLSDADAAMKAACAIPA
jgi:hypothetical protein